MAKSLTASKKVMKNYLSELLTEPIPTESAMNSDALIAVEESDKQLTNVRTAVENKSLEQLLTNVNADITVEVNSFTENKTSPLVNSVTTTTAVPVEETSSDPIEIKSDKKSYREGDFQVMFFDVAGLTIAVPLVELGGIHKVDKTTALLGKPEWFKGVMLHRDDKINVVDTALWVMPEKCNDALRDSLNYQYVIMLDNSSWGMMAENLVDTVVLKQEEVKWLDSTNKRPWLAGLVKERMCALLDVDALITLLDDGSGINQ